MAFETGTTLYIRIDRELQGHISADSLSCSIFKVPNHLRKINEMAYEPQVISIGPYHRGKDHLKAMEVHKKHYLKMLLNRMKENSVEKYLKALKGLKEKALKFYSEPPDLEDGGDQFVEMMLFDGCFVVELIRKSALKELREENDHLLTHFILRTVMRDLLLIENQLPFFILMELFDMTKMPNEANQNFMHMAINCFSIMMPGPSNKTIENHPRIKHLLGLLHDSCLSPDYGGSSEEDEGSSEEGRLLPHPPLPLTPKPATSAPRVTFPPIKTPMLEKSLPSPPPPPPTAPLVTFPPVNTRPSAPLVTFPPDETRPSASLVTFPPTKIPMEETSLPSPSPLPPPPPPSAPLVCVPPSKTPEGVNSLPSDAILTNIHHSEMGAKLESLAPCESSIGAIEDNHHHHCSMKLNDALFSASRKSKEAISGTAKSEGHEEKNCNWQTIRSASELHEAGIKFEKKEGSMFDIKFEKGVMSIPTLKIVDDTESILRNLVAYEQCYKDISSRRFTDYIRFMDCLINTGKDVELLRRHEVIENRLGDSEVIADIFNRICDSVLIAEEEFFYADLFVKVHKHCKRKWNLWKANLWHNYFNTPWAFDFLYCCGFLASTHCDAKYIFSSRLPSSALSMGKLLSR